MKDPPVSDHDRLHVYRVASSSWRFGIYRALVRGIAKVMCVAMLGSIAFNVLQHAASLLG